MIFPYVHMVNPSTWFHSPSTSPMCQTGEFHGFNIIGVLLTFSSIVFAVMLMPFWSLYMSICKVDISATFTEPSVSSLHQDSAPIDDSGGFTYLIGILTTSAIFAVVIMSIWVLCMCMHPLNASISFLGLCTFFGLRLRVLPGGKFGLIQSFWGILTYSCLSVGFLKSLIALCMCVHASGYPFGFWAFLTHPHTVLHKVVLGKFDFILCAAILRYSDALHCVCNPLCGCAPVQCILWTFKSFWLAHIAVCIPMHDGPSTHVHTHLHPSCPNMVQCQCD